MKPPTGFARPREHTGDRATDSIQRARNDIAGVLNNAAFLRGVSTGPVALSTSGNTTINHKLGRQPVGWLMTDITALTGSATLYRVSWDATSITFTMVGVGSCTATFWVF